MSSMSKLLSVQARLVCAKNQRNNFGNYNYRSCEDILEAVKPLLVKERLQLTISDEIVEVAGRVYVKATVTLKDDNNIIETSTGFAREEETKKGMDCSQITGACSSYARKYALNGLFLIDDNKDSDHTNKGQEQPKTQTPPRQYNNSDKEPLPPVERCNEWAEFLKRQVNAKRYYQDVKNSNAPQEVKTHCNSIMYPK